MARNQPANAGDTRDPVSVPGWGGAPGGGNGNPFQYSCLKSSLDRGAWWAVVHGVTRVRTHTHPYSTHLGVFCPTSESLSGNREGFQDHATHKKGSLLLTRARAPAATNPVVRGQRALRPHCYTNLQGVHKQLVAGLSGLVTCLQSNLIGPNLHRLFFKLGCSWAFQLSPDRFPLSY